MHTYVNPRRSAWATVLAVLTALIAMAAPTPAHAQSSCGICPGVVTTFDPAGTAPVKKRMHPNLVPNVTYYLDVDGNAVDSAVPTADSDVSVKVEVVDTQKPKISIQKVTPGAQLPLRAEVVVRSSSSAPWVSGGYDGQTTNAPDSFSVALDLSNRDGNAATDQALADATIVGAASSLTLVSEQFTGDPAGTRGNRTVRSLKFLSDANSGARVPTHILADITRAAKSTRVKVTRDLATRLEYDMTAPGAAHISGHVFPLPNNVNLTLSNDVSVTNPNGTTEVVDHKVDYTADGTADLAFTSVKSPEATTLTVDDVPSVSHLTYSTDNANNPKITYHANAATPRVDVAHTATRVVNNVSQKLTINGAVVGLPANINSLTLSHDANGATAAYAANAGIGQISLKATLTGGTFFGRVNRIEVGLAKLPASNTVKFTKASGGIVASATNAIGGTTSLLASSGAAAPSVAGSAAWFEDTSSIYRAFVRINGLKGVTFKANPVAGTIDTAAPQVFNLHGVTGGVTLDGVIDKLPAHVEFTAPSDRVHIQYSGTPISHVNLTAKGLPAAARFSNAKVDVFGISPVLDVYLGVKQPNSASSATGCTPETCPCEPQIPHDCDPEPDDPNPNPHPQQPAPDPELFGIDAHGNGISRIAVHAWANNADLPTHPDLPASGNEIRFDAKVAGHEDLRANIVNLKSALYKRNDVAGDGAAVEFTQAAPITLGIKKERLDGTVRIPTVSGRTLPTKYGLQLATGRFDRFVFTPNATIPIVYVDLAVGKDEAGQRQALVTGSIQNIPTQATVCYGCGKELGTDKWGGDSTKVIPAETSFSLATNGPPVTSANAMRVDARICLGDLASGAWTPHQCNSNVSAQKYIDIDNLRARNVELEYRNGVTDKFQGNNWDDPSFAAYLNTDGILVDDFRYVKPDGKGVEFIKKTQPLTATGFMAAVNYSASVRAGFMGDTPFGQLSCPPSTELYLLERNSSNGFVSRYDIPVLSDNLWNYIDGYVGC